MSEQTEACEVTRAVVKEQLQARKGELDWDNVPRLVPIALPRPWTLGEVLLAFGFTVLVTFAGFLEVVGGVTFFRALHALMRG